MNRTRLALAVLAAATMCTGLYAHDVVVEQIVTMTVSPQPGGLSVILHVPMSLLNDAGLPRLEDGRVDQATSAAALQVVAADVARNLDFRQRDAALRVQAMNARLHDDGKAVDVDISYGFDGQPDGFSARLNAFQGSPLQPPRTDARYQASSGQVQLMSVTGPATRIEFDPPRLAVIQQFVMQAFNAVLGGGSHLLFLVCLLIPVRPARSSARLVAIVLVAQTAGIVAATAFPATNRLLLPIDMVAWSGIVLLAICGVAGAARRAVDTLCGLFGLLSGVGFGASFNAVRQLAGGHGAGALLTFAVVAIVAQTWLAAVIWATRRWLESIVESERLATIVASALIAHVALHRVVDRGREISLAGSFVAEHATVLLAVGWTLVMVLLALMRLARDTAPLAEPETSDGPGW